MTYAQGAVVLAALGGLVYLGLQVLAVLRDIRAELRKLNVRSWGG